MVNATATRSTENGPKEAATDVVRNVRAALSGKEHLRELREQPAQEQTQDERPHQTVDAPSSRVN